MAKSKKAAPKAAAQKKTVTGKENAKPAVKADVKKTEKKAVEPAKPDVKKGVSANDLITRSQIFEVPFSQIVVEDGFNAREEMGDIKALADSIAVHGVLQPVTGFKKDNKFVLTDGHRRYFAGKMLVEQGKPAPKYRFILEEKEGADRIISMLLRNEGKEFTLLEKGRAYSRLINLGMKQKEVAAKLGLSLSHVNSAVTIASTALPIQEAIESGEIKSSTALEIARIAQSDEEQVEILEKAKVAKVEKKVAVKKAEKVSNDLPENPTDKDVEEALAAFDAEVEKIKSSPVKVNTSDIKPKQTPVGKSLQALYDELEERKLEGKCINEVNMELLFGLIGYVNGNLTPELEDDLYMRFTCEN